MSDAHTFGRGPAGGSSPVDLTADPVDLAPDPIDITPEPGEGTPEEGELMPGLGLADDEPPVRRSRRRVIVLGSALAVGLVGALLLGIAGWRIGAQKDANLDAPAQVAGLTRDDSDRAKSTADYLRSGFAADIDLDESIGVIYKDPADAKRTVLLFGGTTLVWQPERDLDNLFDLVSDDSGKVDGLHEVPAGRLGGVMKCGTTTSQDGELAVCGWADHGSVALAMFSGRTAEESAGLLRAIRDTIQTRG
jgi:hypothetical protein